MRKAAFLIALFPLLLTGCKQQEQFVEAGGKAEVAYGDTIVMGSIGEPSTLLPVLASDSASSEINGMVYSGLLEYDKDLALTGDLAESWEVSTDNLTITFHLRRDVKWHDGAPFTSADVLFTYRLYVDPETPTAYAERYRQVADAQAPDPYTFTVRYDQPLAPALASWALAIHPKHLLEGVAVAESPLGRKPVGTGPYRFAKWLPGQEVVLESNADYFEGRPRIDRVIYRIIPDQSTMFLELRNGGVDFMGVTPIQYKGQADKKAFKRRFNRFRYPSSGYTYLGFNLRRDLFKDKLVRQAISHAIDRQEIIEGVLLGLGQEATGPYKPGTWAYTDQVARYPYSPERAGELLSAAGWFDTDGDGVRERGGEPFSFTIITNQGNDQRIKTGEIIQRRLRQVGIDVKLRVVEWATFLKEFVDPGNFDAIILGWTIPPDPDSYNVWHSSKTHPRELNFIGFKNEEVDELLEKGRRTLDQEQRKAHYTRFQQILAEEQPYAFLYVPDALPVVHRRFHGIEAAPAGISYNFNDWFVPKSQQKYTR